MDEKTVYMIKHKQCNLLRKAKAPPSKSACTRTYNSLATTDDGVLFTQKQTTYGENTRGLLYDEQVIVSVLELNSHLRD